MAIKKVTKKNVVRKKASPLKVGEIVTHPITYGFPAKLLAINKQPRREPTLYTIRFMDKHGHVTTITNMLGPLKRVSKK